MSAYFSWARRLAIGYGSSSVALFQPAAGKFLKTLKANVRLRTSTSTFDWIAIKAILEAHRGSPPLTSLNQGFEVHFTIEVSLQPRFSLSGSLCAGQMKDNDIKRNDSIDDVRATAGAAGSE
jgi:hypothetical protein